MMSQRNGIPAHHCFRRAERRAANLVVRSQAAAYASHEHISSFPFALSHSCSC